MKEIITVRGKVDPASCRMALSHEHLFIDLRNQSAPDAQAKKVTAADRATLLRDPYCISDNLLIDQYEVAAEECKRLLAYGCDTVADCSLKEIGRNPERLRHLSEDTGMKIIMGCGWYTADTHPESVLRSSADFLAEQLVNEILYGVADTGICPGVIGEIGTSKTIAESEWNVLKAAAIAQKRTGLSIQVHIYPWSANGLSVVELLTKVDVPPERIVICHSDVAPDRDYILALLKAGVYVELDNFGKEFVPADGGFAGGRFAKDTERAELAAWIIRQHFEDQLLLTNDICLKCMLQQYGGAGYSHIFRNMIPMIAAHDVPLELLQQKILHENPLRMLSI